MGEACLSSVPRCGHMTERSCSTDTKLDRDVALKILPDAFANDPERLARFQSSSGHCQVDEDSAFLPLEAERQRSFSRRTSPYPTRGTPAFATTGGEPTAADVGPPERD